ncbi:MAG: DNA-directed RNA polymerase subunit H [bacterium]|nr:DNA-directed RNA polymerase subunit H [bacterium]
MTKIKRFSVLEHELVPKHVVLPREEAEQLLRQLGVSKAKLPKISRDDPVVKELGAKPGDIIKIIRKNPFGGTSIYYRVVK